MARTRADELTVAQAKEALRRRSRLLPAAGSPGSDDAGRAARGWAGSFPGGSRALGAALTVLAAAARRSPLRTAALVLAAGVAIGTSRTLRRAALGAVRKALGPGS